MPVKGQGAVIAVLTTKIDNLTDNLEQVRVDVREIKESLGEKYVRKEEFLTLRNTVWGVGGVVFTAVILAGLRLIFN